MPRKIKLSEREYFIRISRKRPRFTVKARESVMASRRGKEERLIVSEIHPHVISRRKMELVSHFGFSMTRYKKLKSRIRRKAPTTPTSRGHPVLRKSALKNMTQEQFMNYFTKPINRSHRNRA